MLRFARNIRVKFEKITFLNILNFSHRQKENKINQKVFKISLVSNTPLILYLGHNYYEESWDIARLQNQGSERFDLMLFLA